jgi:hypothetical protein
MKEILYIASVLFLWFSYWAGLIWLVNRYFPKDNWLVGLYCSGMPAILIAVVLYILFFTWPAHKLEKEAYFSAKKATKENEDSTEENVEVSGSSPNTPATDDSGVATSQDASNNPQPSDSEAHLTVNTPTNNEGEKNKMESPRKDTVPARKPSRNRLLNYLGCIMFLISCIVCLSLIFLHG